MADAGRVAILISGRGSNMRALIEGAEGYQVALVASNKVHAPGLDVARSLGVPTFAFEAPRDAFEAALERSLTDHDVGTIALAGYMRILSPAFIARWRGRIVNIHPSLLPKHKGLDTHGRVLAAGDTVTGCTVHLVSEELDSGARDLWMIVREQLGNSLGMNADQRRAERQFYRRRVPNG